MKLQALSIGFLLLAVVATWLVRFVVHQPVDAERVAGASQAAFGEPFSRVQVSPPPTRIDDREPNLEARALYLVDVASGYPLYAHNESEPVPIASTTKLMTAVVVTEQYDLADEVTVSQEAATTIGSDIHLVPGEVITVEALLKALLIQSGNDAAMALAEHIGLPNFVAQMNEKAAELGMEETEFKDPAGLDDTGRASARDLGVLAAYALRNEVIRGIVRITEATIESTDLRYSHRLETSNRLIKADHPLFLIEATGLKTGYTPEAGHCLVASAQRDGHEVVSVVLATAEDTTEASAKESKKLLQWAFDAFAWK